MPRPSRRHERSPQALEGRYANFFEVLHSAFEFVIDFGQYHPETGGVQNHSRIVLGPVYAKLFTRLLRQSLERFEAEHGAIRDAGEDDELDPIHFVEQSLRRPEPAAAVRIREPRGGR